MKWKFAIPQKSKPNVGDKKQEGKFAFLPIQIGETWIWLECYVVTYEYVTEKDENGPAGSDPIEFNHWKETGVRPFPTECPS